MTQRLRIEDAISVLASYAFPLNEAAFLQILNDPLDSPFGNSHLDGNLAKHLFWGGMQDSQHMCVIGEKRPAGRSPSVAVHCGQPRARAECLEAGSGRSDTCVAW